VEAHYGERSADYFCNFLFALVHQIFLLHVDVPVAQQNRLIGPARSAACLEISSSKWSVRHDRCFNLLMNSSRKAAPAFSACMAMEELGRQSIICFIRSSISTKMKRKKFTCVWLRVWHIFIWFYSSFSRQLVWIIGVLSREYSIILHYEIMQDPVCVLLMMDKIFYYTSIWSRFGSRKYHKCVKLVGHNVCMSERFDEIWSHNIII
jgi:hypothetical protein